MRIVTVTEMRQIEKEAFESGISYEQMMRTAGTKIAEKIFCSTIYPNQTITAIIGPGNNGGDALITLTVLRKHGWITNAWIIRERFDQDDLLSEYQKLNGNLRKYQDDQNFILLDQWLNSSDVFLDGALGIGCHLPLANDYSVLFSHIQDLPKNFMTIAVDCPSGMDCNTGDCDKNCIQADLTLCIEALKIGEIQHPGYHFTGHIDRISLDLPENLPVYQTIKRFSLEKETLRNTVPVREIDGNKGTFGTVAIIGGSYQYIGAPILTGMAAYKTGCGLVNMFVPQIVRDISASSISEAIWTIMDLQNQETTNDCLEKIDAIMKKKHAIVIGPGFGHNDLQTVFVKRIFEKMQEGSYGLDQNFVIDADGLNLLASLPNWDIIVPQVCILTPHPGEFSRLSKLTIQEIQKNRIQVSEKFALTWNKVIVLKGAFTVIASPDGRTAVMPLATSALAKAGSGDILSGIIAGFLAQGVADQFAAACLGVWIHGKTGILAKDRIGNEYSVTATDIVQSIPESITKLLV